MHTLRSLLTYSNVMATVAVFIALGGTSYAVATNSISSRQVKNNSIRGVDIRDDSVTGKDIRESSLAEVGSAAKADSANSATNATNASNAASLGGSPAAAYQRFGGTLPSGQSESGDFGLRTANSNTGTTMDQSVSFPIALAARIPGDKVVYTNNPSATHCPGPGKADPGYLCIYESSSAGLSATADVQSFEDQLALLGSGRFGFDLQWSVMTANAFAVGTWTVTAP
jgi:hypothetical protein